MVRITDGQYLAIINNGEKRIIEVYAKSEEEAKQKILDVFGNGNISIELCKIPSIISYIGK